MSYDSNGNLLLAPLLANIENEGFELQNHVVNYYSDNDKAFVHVGKFPIQETSSVEMLELDPNKPLRIRLIPPPPQVNKKNESTFGQPVNSNTKIVNSEDTFGE